jgi:multiple sugar transport system ATP-binding protein
MADVALEHIDKQYANGVRALSDFNLAIADGELLVLVGPSGSGKTTALRLIAGLEAPTSGAIRIGGHHMNGVPPRQRNVALVFQQHSLYPHLSIHDNLAFGLRLREQQNRLSRLWLRWFRPAHFAEVQQTERQWEERVQDAARVLELRDLLARRPSELSGGEQQRAALGRALVRQPAVFLLDEPLSQLDPRLRADLRRELHLLHQRLRATMIYVTHDQLDAMILGDRIAVLDRGVLQQVGQPAEVYTRPWNRFVARFIGWPPMSFLEGRLVTKEGRLHFECADCLWSLEREQGKRLAPWTGRDVTLGIRPEHVTLAASERAGAVAMKVNLVEFLGNEYLVTVRRNIMAVTARVPELPRPAVGAIVGVSFDMQRCHWFDRSTGAALMRQEPDG